MINISYLDLANNLAKENTIWDISSIVSVVTKVSFYLWRDRYPRDFETVIRTFSHELRNDQSIRKVYKDELIEGSVDELVKKIRDILFSIPEFKKWNLTENEYIHGVDPDSTDRSKYFKAGDFFIDLDAFMQNVHCELRDSLVFQQFYGSSSKYMLYDDSVTLTISVDGVNNEEDICLIDLDAAINLLSKATVEFKNLYEHRLRECDPL